MFDWFFRIISLIIQFFFCIKYVFTSDIPEKPQNNENRIQEFFKKIENKKSIYYFGQKYGKKGIDELCNHIENNFLKEIHLNFILLEKWLIQICSSIEKNPYIEELKFQNCNTTVEVCKCISFILHNSKTIKKFEMKFFGNPVNGLKFLSEALKKNSFLKVLKLKTDPLNDSLISTDIFKNLLMNDSIIELNVAANLIFPSFKDDDSFNTYIQNTKNLTHLNVKNCNLTPQNITGFVESLKINKSIISLKISKNDIGIEGTQNLFDILKEKHDFESLKLSFTGKEELNCEIIGDYLKDNTSLKNLSIDRDSSLNGICQKVLLENLQNNFSLQSFEFNSTDLFKEEIRKILERNFHLRDILIHFDCSKSWKKVQDVQFKFK